MCEQFRNSDHIHNNRRQCTVCKKWKPMNEKYFEREPRTKVGFNSKCRDCRLEYNRKYKASHREEIREYNRKWRQENPDKVKASSQRYRENHPECIAAHKAVLYALKTGKLTKQPCVVCGNPDTEAHHISYDKTARLKVIWLCKEHHAQVHQDPFKQIPKKQKSGATIRKAA